MPMTEKGFRKLSFAEILAQQIQRAEQLFGSEIDTSEKSVIGKYIRLNASDFARQEEELEAVWLSRYIDTACGLSLDRLAPFAGIVRNAPTRAIILAKVHNNGKTTAAIAMGTKIISESGILYHSVEKTVIPAESESLVKAECDIAGIVGNCENEDFRFYNTQLPNVKIVSAELSTVGTDAETDENLRRRWRKAILGSGSGTLSAVIGKVLRVPGVEDCILIENETDEKIWAAEQNIPPHSFALYVYAGIYGNPNLSDEIAKAVFRSKPLGIGTSGGITVSVADMAGVTHDISFSYVSVWSASVEVTISREEEPEFDIENDGNAIKKAVSDYVNQNYRIGQPLYASSLYVPVIMSGSVKSVQSITTDGNDKCVIDVHEKIAVLPQYVTVKVV